MWSLFIMWRSHMNIGNRTGFTAPPPSEYRCSGWWRWCSKASRWLMEIVFGSRVTDSRRRGGGWHETKVLNTIERGMLITSIVLIIQKSTLWRVGSCLTHTWGKTSACYAWFKQDDMLQHALCCPPSECLSSSACQLSQSQGLFRKLIKHCKWRSSMTGFICRYFKRKTK